MILEALKHPNLDISIAAINLLDNIMESDEDQTDQELLAKQKVIKSFVKNYI